MSKKILSEEMRDEIVSILFAGLGIFTLTSLISYHPADTSIFSLSTGGQAQNACGRVGAWVASLLLQGIGMSAFLVPLGFFFSSVGLLKKEGGGRAIASLLGIGVAAISATVFLAQLWKYFPFAGTLILTGGFLGEWVSRQLAQELNPVGTSILAAIFFLMALAVSTPMSVAKLLGAGLSFLGSYSLRGAKLGLSAMFRRGRAAALALAEFASRQFTRGLVVVRKKIHEFAKNRLRWPRWVRLKSPVSEPGKKSMASPVTGQPEPTLALMNGPVGPSSGAHSIAQDIQRSLDIKVINAVASEVPEADSDSIDLAAMASQVRGQQASPGVQSSLGLGPEILPREDLKNQGAEATASGLGTKKILTTSGSGGGRRNRGRGGIWRLPTTEFLKLPPKIDASVDRVRLSANAEILTQKFRDFGIDGEVTAVKPGPVITLYEFKPGKGVKVSRIAALADDLSMALSAQSVRILAPLPGKAVVGIEIPSDTRENVYLREFLQHADFFGGKHQIPVVMGKEIGGTPVLSDLARMPHLLCAGQTGSGKSVFMNGLICSLLYRFTPDELRLILVDPKFIEFRAYQDIPHLLLPVVDDPKEAATALRWAVREMERRYRILAKIGVRNLQGFNQKVDDMGPAVVRDLLFAEENNDGEDSAQAEMPSSLSSSLASGGASKAGASGSDWIEAFEPDDTGAPKVGRLPNIVIIIDELADLMMIAKKEVEVSIARIAQKARAAGIHLVIATQRPSTDVVTGLIKANLPSRVSFQLASFVDSKTILDRAGAERLLGQGDMLFIPPGISQALRLQGAFVDDDEIQKIASYLKGQGKPSYRDEILIDDEADEATEDDSSELDPLFDEAVELVKRSSHASASFLQRHLKIGYNRAARLIETMEERGIVGAAEGARPREILLNRPL